MPTAALVSLATSVPPHVFRQKDVLTAAWQAFGTRFPDFERFSSIFTNTGIVKRHGVKPFEWFARAYVLVFRGTPLLIQLFVVYYGLASLPAVRASFAWGFLRSAFNCAVLALALCTAAYQAEIFRGALLAVPHGQVEAARACGMSKLLMFRRIFFPIALRHALPAYSTEMISMVKSTALVSLVTLWDVMSIALKIRNDTLVTYLPLILAGAIYFVINYIIGAGFLALERRLSPHLRPRPS